MQGQQFTGRVQSATLVTTGCSWFLMRFSYLGERNLPPKRYVWKATGEEILAKIKRARERLNEIIKRTWWTLH